MVIAIGCIIYKTSLCVHVFVHVCICVYVCMCGVW